jgi:nitrile hydratase subunit beta
MCRTPIIALLAMILIIENERGAIVSPMDGIHDLGGMHGFGAVVTPGGEAPYHERWEPRVFAMQVLTGLEGLGGGPGSRATVEQMDPASYLRASYYERWLWATEQRLLRKGTIAPGEVERMMERLAAGESEPRRGDPEQAARAVASLREVDPLPPAERARFAPGQRVRVRRMHPAGHTRCPRYVRGAVGVVEHVRVAAALPDVAGPGDDAPVEPTYAVAFRSDELWGRGDEPTWTVMLDLWESYLEAAARRGSAGGSGPEGVPR